MEKSKCIGPWIRRFLIEYLLMERNFSVNTQKSYRDTIILLLRFSAVKIGKRNDQLKVDDLSAQIIREFLSDLEKSRSCSPATRNQRLAAIRSLSRFIAENAPEYIAWSEDLRSVKFKKTTQTVVAYLEKIEVDAILRSPNQRVLLGQRDYAALLFLYNTGARASEVINVTIEDLELQTSQSVKIHGKGKKIRHCPLWDSTAAVVSNLAKGRSSSDKLFLNRVNGPLTRFGLHNIVERHTLEATKKLPSLKKKQVSPHTFRHTTAVHLLRAGVDINTIRAWLGHVSLDTTNIYAEVDLEMKSKALAMCEVSNNGKKMKYGNWKNDKDLMTFLSSI